MSWPLPHFRGPLAHNMQLVERYILQEALDHFIDKPLMAGNLEIRRKTLPYANRPWSHLEVKATHDRTPQVRAVSTVQESTGE